MSSHVIALFDRDVVADYPSSLTGNEQVFYGAGMAYKYPLHCRVDRSALGSGSIVKIQGAPLPVNKCDFAVRGPSGQHGLLSITAKTGDFYRVIMTQKTGVSAAIGSTFTAGLLTILLPTDASGNASGSIAVVEAYINASLTTDFAATSSGFTAGVLGSTLFDRPVPREHWEDIVSTIGGLLPATVEHTITPAISSFLEVAIEVDARNYYAIRALAKGDGGETPAAGDHCAVLATVEGA